MNIDLNELRITLDQMTERIISRFKDRSRYPLNNTVYEKNAIQIVDGNDLSFFEYALKGLEEYHATLGRYSFPDQHPIVNDTLTSSPVERIIPALSISNVEISIKDNLIDFYITLLSDLCKLGEDPTTYGETVYCDSDLVELLNERINIGRLVAESKIQTSPSILNFTTDEELIKKLRYPEREEIVINKAKNIAKRYELNTNIVENVFKWIIEQTIKVEVEYIKKKTH